MIGTENISETMDFNSALTRLIFQENWVHLFVVKALNLTAWSTIFPRFVLLTAQILVHSNHFGEGAVAVMTLVNQVGSLNLLLIFSHILQYYRELVRRNQSQWPRGLSHEMPSPTWTLGSWIWIPLKAWISVFILCLGTGSYLATGWSPVQGVWG
jgi:hypothetical protein